MCSSDLNRGRPKGDTVKSATLFFCQNFMKKERQNQLKLVADLTANSVSSSQIDSISGYLQNWDEVSFNDKQRVVDTLISKIETTSIGHVIH